MLPPHLLRCLDERAEKIFRQSYTEVHAALAEKYQVLPYMVQRFEEIFGDLNQVKEFLEMGPNDIPKAIRVNTLRTNKDALKEMLEEKGFVLRDHWIPYALVVVEEPISIGATHEYMQGLYYIQGLGSQIPVYITDPKPLQKAVDMTAAPGGKTTQIAQHMRDIGVIVAVDVSKKRLATLKNHLNRLGIKSVIALALDARELDTIFNNYFDYVLLDAPCTGEGLIPLDPTRRKSRTLVDLADRACLQKQLLETAVKIVKPGGLIIYTTCSIAPEENEYVVSMILDSREDVEVIEPHIKPPKYIKGLQEFHGVEFNNQVVKCIRLHPHITRTEGFVVCVLRKRT